MKYYKCFGTDGIRGTFGDLFINPDFFLKLGWSIGSILNNYGLHNIVVGQDTRMSSSLLKSALAAGLSAAGLSVLFAGIIPTPAIAYLTRVYQATSGIMISASHNPFYDNGVKFFFMNGIKFSNKLEKDIEITLNKQVFAFSSFLLRNNKYINDASSYYIEFCINTFPKHLSLKSLKIVLDCANGSTYRIAPIILSELGADIIPLSCQPNGININQQCGSTNIHRLQNVVVKEKADLGIAYDGDGDRVIMIDHFGNKVDGDQIVYIIAREKMNKHQLNGGVVGTWMSNTGLSLALRKLGIPFIRTNVGDHNVIKMLNATGWLIGAENSGHVILLDKTTTGDGIITCLEVLSVIVSHCTSLYNLCKDLYLFPQILCNVYYNGDVDPLESIIVKHAYKSINHQLTGRGRILLRKSGTEPYIRVMLEGYDVHEIMYFAEKIISVLKTVK